jgi:serine/threonine-protein kinase
MMSALDRHPMTETCKVGRYEIHDAIASGGMATVHLGRLKGTAGFSRTVAIKRLYPQFANAPELVSTLLDEAHLVSRIRHPNVVATLDVVADGDELCVVMEYVHGESLARLMRGDEPGQPMPVGIAAGVMVGVLHGLHAAHEATSESGEPLGIVHRDVSPQNIMVGTDGLARVLDFGVAKAKGRLQTTRDGQIKGKLAYMAPEQVGAGDVSRRTDVFGAGVVLWEALTGQRLFGGEYESEVLASVILASIEPPSTLVPELSAELDAVVLKALRRHSADRYDSARDFALALADATDLAPPWEIGDWVKSTADSTLAERSALVSALEQGVSLSELAPASTDPDAATTSDITPAESAKRSRRRHEPVGPGTEVTTPSAHVLAPSKRAARKRRSGTMVASAALVAVALVAALLWNNRDREPPRRLESRLAAGVASAAAVVPDTTPSAASSAPLSGQATAEGEVAVEVQTTPAGAIVTVGSKRYGPTPIEFRLEKGSDPIELTVSKPGRVTQVRELVPDRSHRIELVLLPVRTPGRGPPPPPASTASKPFGRFD